MTWAGRRRFESYGCMGAQGVSLDKARTGDLTPDRIGRGGVSTPHGAVPFTFEWLHPFVKTVVLTSEVLVAVA